jgi:hypothetical protein
MTMTANLGKCDNERLDPFFPRAHFEYGACFAAGTAILTPDGYTMIEKIKIGDFVLSQPETQGERAYKRVVNTFVREEKMLRCIKFIEYREGDQPPSDIFVTEEHPFWAVGEGWTAAAFLSAGDELELEDSSKAMVVSNLPVYRTSKPDVGWTPNFDDDEGRHGGGEGSTKNFTTGMPLEDNVGWDFSLSSINDPYLRTQVYNIEVEDFHTYYIYGIWVHNANCKVDEFKLFRAGNGKNPAELASLSVAAEQKWVRSFVIALPY